MYADIVTEDQRLAILRLLEQDPDYAHNEYVIARLLAAVGHTVSGDRVRTQLSWLAEQGLVQLTDAAGVMVAKLTSRGEDTALGRTRVPGVARPRPGM